MQRQDDELKVLGGHARVVSVAASRRSSYVNTTPHSHWALSPPMDFSSSPLTNTPPTTDLHPALMEDLAGVRQQDLNRDARKEMERFLDASPGIREGQSISAPTLTPAEVEMFSAEGSQPQPYAHTGPVEVQAHQFQDIGDTSHSLPQRGYFNLSDIAVSSFSGQQQQQHHPGATAGAGGSVSVIDDFGNIFSIAPSTAQEWGVMVSDDYTDMCWQGFVAGLGVSGGDLG